MAIDGDLLFQSDRDADVVSSFQTKYGVDLACYRDEDEPESSNVKNPPVQVPRRQTKAEIRAILNNGLLTQVFREHMSLNAPTLLSLFLFMAKAMQVGANFSNGQLVLLKGRVPIIMGAGIFFRAGINQIIDALEKYPNDGTPFELDRSLSEM